MRDRHLPGHYLLLVVLVALSGALAARKALAQGPNVLQNPGFEGTYAPYNGETTRNVASGWTPWNLPPKSGDPSYVNATPEYRPAASASRVHSGSTAQEYFTFYATHDAGVYQQIPIPAGSKLRFSAWINVWSTNNDDPTRSQDPGEVKVRVGIDPNGGTDASAAGIVWSDEQEYYDQYRQLSVEATAASGNVTVFVRSNPHQPVKNNHVYVDDAQLVITGAIPTATGQPSATPLPSATPSPFPAATVTPSDTPIGPTPFPSPTREGTIPPTVPSNTPGGPTDTPAPTATPPSEVTTDTPVPGLTSTTNPIATSIPTAAPTVPGFPYQISYQVTYGDTVYDLAIRFNSSIDAIIAANGLNEEGLIFVGQQLIIPVSQLPTPAAPTAVINPTLAPRPTNQPPIGPPPPPALVGPTLNGIGTYIVQPGDDLFRIALLYNITPGALAHLNGIVNASQVRVGQVLVVPGPGNNAGGQAPTPYPVPTRRTHVVQPGENLFRIALQYQVTLDALMRANGIYNPNIVYVGQVLTIP